MCGLGFSRVIKGNIKFGFRVPEEGDIVTAGQCRPLAKTVRFNVLKVVS